MFANSAVSASFHKAGLVGSVWPVAVNAPQRRARNLNQAAEGKQAMKVRNSLKSLRGRHRDNRLVRRKGRVYIINKTNRRFKARQG